MMIFVRHLVNPALRGVGRKHHLTGMKLPHHQIAEPVTNRPFEAAIAPVDSAVRPFKFGGDIVYALPRFRRALPISRDRWYAPHPIAPRRQPWEAVESDFHRAPDRNVTNRGEIGEAYRAAKVVAAGFQLAFEHAE